MRCTCVCVLLLGYNVNMSGGHNISSLRAAGVENRVGLTEIGRGGVHGVGVRWGWGILRAYLISEILPGGCM